MNRTPLLPRSNSSADIVSSQWRELPSRTPGPVPVAEAGRNHEFELLRACCLADAVWVAQALSHDLQWDQVFKLAGHHRVVPALYMGLQGRPEVPASIQLALRSRYMTHCQRVMRFSAELAEILRHFDSRSIPVIAQKGPGLAHFLYGDTAMREFGDLDLLVRPVDVPQAVTALRELGYDQNLQLSLRQENAYLRTGYEYVFGRGPERNLIELQWNLLPRFYSVDIDIDGLFARSREIQFDGMCARVLSLEDQMLFLCVHAAKHQWAQLGMIRDIASLARLGVDWNRVFDDARRSGISRIVLVSLLLANQVLGANLPEAAAAFPEMPECRRLVTPIVEDLIEARERPGESISYFHFILHLRERQRDRVRFLWRLATTPSVGEWKAVRIPDALFPLYCGVRFLRLIHRVMRRHAASELVS